MSQILLPSKNNAEFNIKDMIDDDKLDIDTSFDKADILDMNSSNILQDVNKSPNFGSNKQHNTSNILYPKKNHSFLSPNDYSLEYKSGPKHKYLLNSINITLQNYLDGFSNVLFNDVIKKYNDEINELYEEKYSKKFVIYKNYHSQISEMELMMKDDDNHSESIKLIIENLEEERDNEIKKLEEEYSIMVEEKEKKLKENSKEGSGVSLVEEKFKIDMLNILNEIINSK